jgi:hypothetical protein
VKKSASWKPRIIEKCGLGSGRDDMRRFLDGTA